MKSISQKKFWKKQGKVLKRSTEPDVVEPLSQYQEFRFRKEKVFVLNFPKRYTPLQLRNGQLM